MFTKQFYWYNFAGFCSNLKQFYWYKLRGLLFKLRSPRAFQLSRGLSLGAYWLAGSRSPDGGGESHHFTETETQVPAACQPQSRQPHIIKLISQLQKPTRKISDAWIIHTDKRETIYQLVKVHQTIRWPHITSFILLPTPFILLPTYFILLPTPFILLPTSFLFYSQLHKKFLSQWPFT